MASGGAGDVKQLVAIAAYVEQMLSAEFQWIQNRLNWLLISQSFCITAYAVLVTSKDSRFPSGFDVGVLRFGLPLFGVLSCVCVGFAVHAAGKEGHALADERARLSIEINTLSQSRIPRIGGRPGMRDRVWTLWLGRLPLLLPWILLVFWFVLLVLQPFPKMSWSSASPSEGRFQLVTGTGPNGAKVWLVDSATGKVVPEDRLEYGKPRLESK